MFHTFAHVIIELLN